MPFLSKGVLLAAIARLKAEWQRLGPKEQQGCTLEDALLYLRKKAGTPNIPAIGISSTGMQHTPYP